MWHERYTVYRPLLLGRLPRNPLRAVEIDGQLIQERAQVELELARRGAGFVLGELGEDVEADGLGVGWLDVGWTNVSRRRRGRGDVAK